MVNEFDYSMDLIFKIYEWAEKQKPNNNNNNNNNNNSNHHHNQHHNLSSHSFHVEEFIGKFENDFFQEYKKHQIFKK